MLPGLKGYLVLIAIVGTVILAIGVASGAAGNAATVHHYPITLNGIPWTAVPVRKSANIEEVMLMAPEEHGIVTQAEAIAVARLYAAKYAPGCTYFMSLPSPVD